MRYNEYMSRQSPPQEVRIDPVICDRAGCHEYGEFKCEECREYFCEDHAIALAGCPEAVLCIPCTKRHFDTEEAADLIEAELVAA